MKLPRFFLALLLATSLSPALATETPVISMDGRYAGVPGGSTPVTLAPRPMDLRTRIDAALKAKGADYRPRTEHLRPDGSPRYTNRLILEDSPYLIQHAHNPVDWYAWGAEAFEKAKRENKPIFLSIGYATCHWCHVMERESFENPAIAELLNRHFVAIKVDRERRPEVDQTYMTAVQLIAGRGGWPLNGFLTPDGKPFHGGTYYPPDPFRDLVTRVAALWDGKRQEVLDQAERVAQVLAAVQARQAMAGEVGREAIQAAVTEALETHDELQGGFGPAPKFPREPLLMLLLNAAERSPEPALLEAIGTTLDAIARGGIHDQVGGGFHRYATDNDWLVPHFEKMLYNQAQLARVYLLAWRLTGNPLYRRVASQTLDYVLRDMRSAEGAFYSAIDADSEGREGTFFLWTPDQLRGVLPAEDAALAINLFGVTDNGNFEGGNILHLPRPLAEFAGENGMSQTQLLDHIDRIRERLYQAREARPHPLRDDKILTAWNGMMITTLAQAGDLLGEPRYTEAAARAARFLWEQNHRETGELWRVHLDGSSSIPALQEDYAYFAEGLLQLYDGTGDRLWLVRARELADAMLERFWDETRGGFYMSHQENQLTALGRAREMGGDTSMPSGNSVALRVLQMLSVRTDWFDYGERARATLAAFAEPVARHPPGFGYLLAGADDLLHGEWGRRRYAALGGIRISAAQVGARRVTVELEIPPGWHVNAHQPLQENLIPTTLALVPGTGGWHLGQIDYPVGERQQLEFQREPLSLYQGKVQIEATIEPVAPASRIVPLRLGLQACNDQVCLAPETVELHLPLADAGMP
ncbi:DUF255 domain-containing protein [Sedimenticola hydrogenitrophicus]|uniref:DUF255 domain-containing protein n=1 Tax=Sedimenticola hydrogenitrophicus TaxID=2967975 RepID=UPI0023AF767D|nr:DUF255 domain-containing protein [Sedimenticola hydrogenitrophicus]